MKANDSIIGCGDSRYGVAIGSKTHRILFPINVSVQLFSQGDLWKELFFKMSKNTLARVHAYPDCIKSSYFLDSVNKAKERNLFIDSSLTDEYCWSIEKMGDSYEFERCAEFSVGGTQYPYFCEFF
jgi:superfamily I DNA and RNA helicase